MDAPTAAAAAYESTAQELVTRIRALIPANPQILTMDSAWDLFKVPGFECNDIGPSLAQAQCALAHAKREGPLTMLEQMQ